MPEYPDYPDAGTLAGDEPLVIVKDGVTKKTTTGAIAGLAAGAIPDGTVTGQIPVWDNDLGQWTLVIPTDVTAADIPASSVGYVNSDGTTVQAVLDDFDPAISAGGGGGGGGPVVADTFTRPDSSTSLGAADTGQAWAALSGVWGIMGNKARKISSSAIQFAVIDAGAGHADGTVSCAVTTGGGGTSYRGVVARASDVNNLLFVQLGHAEDSITLFKRIGGVNTALVGATTTLNAGTTYVIDVVMAGTTVNVYLDGVLKCTWSTTTGLEANTKHGLYALEAQPSGSYDAFSVT